MRVGYTDGSGNLVYRDETAEEIAKREYWEQEYPHGEDIAPTQNDRIEAQVMYTALMTDTLLEV